jgi:hypothetical protein
LLHTTSHHFTSHNFTSHHFTPVHFTSLHNTLHHFTSHFTSLLHTTSHRTTSLNVTSHHLTSLHFTSLHFTLLHLFTLNPPLELTVSLPLCNMNTILSPLNTHTMFYIGRSTMYCCLFGRELRYLRFPLLYFCTAGTALPSASHLHSSHKIPRTLQSNTVINTLHRTEPFFCTPSVMPHDVCGRVNGV